uniref:MSP domain-containing protein n=2 Tax=Parascaris univalens TaxID=6257 RepID=A0A915CCD8_PARUN
MNEKSRVQDSSWELSQRKRSLLLSTDGKKAQEISERSEIIKDAITNEGYVKRFEGMKVKIEPDNVWVCSNEEMIVEHEITNENTFPIAFRVKVTNRNRFRLNKISGIIPAKGTFILQIRRLQCDPKSERFDVEILPYDEDFITCIMNVQSISIQNRIQWFFSLGYIPIVRNIRYRQNPPWDTLFAKLNNPQNLRISAKLASACNKVGITNAIKDNLTLNEFIMLDTAFCHIQNSTSTI